MKKPALKSRKKATKKTSGTSESLPEKKSPIDDLRYYHIEATLRGYLEVLKKHPFLSEEHLSRLAHLAANCTNFLNQIAVMHTDKIKVVAQKHLAWPIMLSPSKASFDVCSIFLKNIELGKNSLSGLDAEKFNNKNHPLRRYIILAIEEICELQRIGSGKHKMGIPQIAIYLSMKNPKNQDPFIVFARECVAIPKLNPTTIGTWIEKVWKSILLSTGGHPERIPALRALGWNRAWHRIDHKENEPDKLEKIRVGTILGPKKCESNIRDGIHKSYRQMFSGLVKSI